MAIAHTNVLDDLEESAAARATQGVDDARAKRECLEGQTSEILAKNCEGLG